MIKILFVRSERAFLPEIDAYIDYFNKSSKFTAYDSSKIEGLYNINDFDIIWEFKGIGGHKPKNKFVIHDYASLSTGYFPKTKNKIKRVLNPKPDMRIFLNKEVQSGFKFKDNIEYCYRDMGISEAFVNISNYEKEYEFVYTGVISRSRGMDKALSYFSEKKIGKICLIGTVEDEIYNQYKYNKDFIFTGKIDYIDVPKIASKGIYGLNFIPDKYPYNLQTSTKLLEYLALGLNIVTTDYRWIREFENKYKCSFYKVNSKNIELDINDIKNYKFKSKVNINEFIWKNVIEKSEIKQKILSNIK